MSSVARRVPSSTPVGEHLLPEVERLGALGEQTGELLVAREVRPVVVQDPDLGPVRRAQAHDAADHRLELLRTGAALGDRGVLLREQLLVERPDDEVEDLRLRTEVRVEASRQHPARVGDVDASTCRRTPARRSTLGDGRGTSLARDALSPPVATLDWPRSSGIGDAAEADRAVAR